MTQTYDNETVRAPHVPPRQQVTRKFPVVGERAPTPEALDVRQWRLRITGEVQQPRTWTYDELLRLPQVEVEHDIHCVTRWSRLGCRWRGVALTTVVALVSPTPAAHFVAKAFARYPGVRTKRQGAILFDRSPSEREDPHLCPKETRPRERGRTHRPT